MSKQPRKPPPKPEFSLIDHFREVGYRKIVGLDEVGRGALAGPLVVAAVELTIELPGVTDSKLLTADQRTQLSGDICYHAQQVKVSQVSNEETDELGLAVAQELAYLRALEQIDADLVLTDNYPLKTGHQHLKAIKGDQLFYPVAAASIVAKVYRDQLMRTYHQFFPHFGWQENVGYGTKLHLESIRSYGVSALHRQSFLKEKPPGIGG